MSHVDIIWTFLWQEKHLLCYSPPYCYAEVQFQEQCCDVGGPTKAASVTGAVAIGRRVKPLMSQALVCVPQPWSDIASPGVSNGCGFRLIELWKTVPFVLFWNLDATECYFQPVWSYTLRLFMFNDLTSENRKHVRKSVPSTLWMKKKTKWWHSK